MWSSRTKSHGMPLQQSTQSVHLSVSRSLATISGVRLKQAFVAAGIFPRAQFPLIRALADQTLSWSIRHHVIHSDEKAESNHARSAAISSHRPTQETVPQRQEQLSFVHPSIDPSTYPRREYGMRRRGRGGGGGGGGGGGVRHVHAEKTTATAVRCTTKNGYVGILYLHQGRRADRHAPSSNNTKKEQKYFRRGKSGKRHERQRRRGPSARIDKNENLKKNVKRVSSGGRSTDSPTNQPTDPGTPITPDFLRPNPTTGPRF